MAAITAIFVSKRLRASSAALLCLMMAQLLVLASCDGEHDLAPMAAKVAISQR
jgi:hypothetical protein